ncbi:beta-catenin-like protein 1 [Poecilia latipinna]|nr:PREDICTED: beta-catenin-like protein 1 [Poecilia latipinna]
MAEFRPGLCTEAAQQGLMQWLLKRIKAKMPFDANKLYCSEILAILLQNNDTTRELLGEMDGIDVLLQQLSVFKRHNPNTAEEQEMMENLFDALCSCLMLSSNRDRFLKGEGLQLMNLMLREKKMSRTSALKVLDHAMIGPEGADNCHKFVDVLGLRTIFPLFMKTPKKMKKTGTSEKEHEGQSVITECGSTNMISLQRPQPAAKLQPCCDLFKLHDPLDKMAKATIFFSGSCRFLCMTESVFLLLCNTLFPETLNKRKNKKKKTLKSESQKEQRATKQGM